MCLCPGFVYSFCHVLRFTLSSTSIATYIPHEIPKAFLYAQSRRIDTLQTAARKRHGRQEVLTCEFNAEYTLLKENARWCSPHKNMSIRDVVRAPLETCIYRCVL
jgi:hypothetical protein